MRRFLGLLLAAGLWFGHASPANAQLGVYVNTPFTSVEVGSPYGIYGSGYYPSSAIDPYYNMYAPFSRYGAPGTAIFYSSGYAGITPYATTYSYTYPSYGYSYGYLPYSYGYYGYGPYVGGGVVRSMIRRSVGGW
jgi:hypothetical protein